MAELTVQQITTAGIDTSTTAADAGGDTFINNGNTYLEVANGGGSSINVTVDSITPCNQGFDHDVVVAVPAGEDRKIGPFPANRFSDTSDSGRASVSYSDVTSVTVAAVSL